MTEISFYFDESVEVAVSIQTALNGLDTVSAHSLGALGDTDARHLQRATEMGRVLCTYDADFLALARAGIEHSGIIYAKEQNASIGVWVRELRMLHANRTAEDIQGLVLFLRPGR